MSSGFGKILHISVFGESHGPAIGVLIEGLPAGSSFDEKKLEAFMSRRRPGGRLSTPRREKDTPVFLSGCINGVIGGTPLCAIIKNTDAHSGDYAEILSRPRPGHADYTSYIRYLGSADMRGGGHFSGRLTAPVCIAGGIALQLLEKEGIHIGAHLVSVGRAQGPRFPQSPTPSQIHAASLCDFPAEDAGARDAMIRQIEMASADGDSVGGIIECAAIGLPAGLGSPMFDGVEGRLAQAFFGIPAVKGVEFGAGFEAAGLRGSENNDPFEISDGKVTTSSNNCGGILGGITDGMPLVARAAIKPTPSIAAEQATINLKTMSNDRLSIKGRHDPCIAPRAVPVVEATMALVLLDMLLESRTFFDARQSV